MSTGKRVVVRAQWHGGEFQGTAASLRVLISSSAGFWGGACLGHLPAGKRTFATGILEQWPALDARSATPVGAFHLEAGEGRESGRMLITRS